MIDFSGVESGWQQALLSISAMFTAGWVFWFIIVKQKMLKGLIGLVVIGFATVIVIDPQGSWAFGRWLYENITIG